MIDLWAEINLLDMGERLGRYITGFRDEYFKPDKRNGAIVYHTSRWLMQKKGYMRKYRIYVFR